MKTLRIILLTIITFGYFTLTAQDEFTLVKVGDSAPDFSFSTENGQTKKLSELKGKVVWINFFATWCGPCRQELPHLQKEVYDKLKNNKNFELIILGREHTWEEINKFKTDNKYNMPFYPDTGRKVFSLYAKQNIPRNFVIGKDGKIAVTSTGFTEKEFAEIISKVEGLLK
jgi:peroxiredoxin